MPATPYCPHRRPRTPIESYFRDIDHTALLDADQEQDLGHRVGAGDPEARDHLVRANLRLVVNIARGYRGQGLPLEDLIAEGNLGLLRAAEGYDPAVSTRFSTYASFWVKQSIRRALTNQAPPVRLPNYMRDLVARWSQAAAALREELGRAPAPEEVGERLGLRPKRLRIIQKALRVHQAGLQTDRAGEDGQALSDLVPDDLAGAPGDRLARADELGRVLGLLGRLGAREAAVLRLRFGLGGEDPLSLQEIGDRLGLTRERVRQLEKQALAQLREALGADEA